MIKQYMIEKAYTDNYKIILYEDGKKISYDIVAYYEQEGYIMALESMGYTMAYNTVKAYEKFCEAKEEYELALTAPLFVKED